MWWPVIATLNVSVLLAAPPSPLVIVPVTEALNIVLVPEPENR